MTSQRFIFSILSVFATGILLLIFMQYNYSKNINDLIRGNNKLMYELKVNNQLRELERDMLTVESRIRGAAVLNDITYLEGLDFEISEAKDDLNSLLLIHNQDSNTIKNIRKLYELADEKLRLKNRIIDTFYATGNIATNSIKTAIGDGMKTGQINNTIRKVYNSRQLSLNILHNEITTSATQARLWGGIMIILVLLSEMMLLWYIINKIKKQHNLIQQLDTSEKKLRELSIVKENFLINISHEIRTPMNAILGFTNILMSKNKNPELNEFVESISQSGKNLLGIINDILDISKIESGMMHIDSAPFSIHNVIQSIQVLFSERTHEKTLIYTTSIDKNVPDILLGDALRLTQILVNIVGNAVKFTSYGKISLEVHAIELSNDTTTLEFVIRDTGIGISKEKLPEVFERFIQAENSVTRKYGGTGLGLSIAKELVTLQNGTISVESELGKGTTFTFSIPFEIVKNQLEISHSLPHLAEIHNVPDINILVAEDNSMNQNLVKHLLNEWKLGFEIVDNGIEAIKRLETGHFDLVLMDIQMPEMDGYTATIEIRTRLQSNIPIIAMTAHAFEKEREQCIKSGMNGYITKPINNTELFKQIKAATMDIDLKTNLPQHMGEERAKYKYINLEYIRDISNGNKNYERTTAMDFLEVIPSDISTLEDSLARKDIPGLRHAAHSMKNDISAMGMSGEIRKLLDVLEEDVFDNTVFAKSVAEIKAICLDAMNEARDFHASLSA